MKKLLILPLLILLGSCVSYYHPETALVDGVYYAEDDPSYVVYQDAYSGAYYPWSSLDYFYMGYYSYPRLLHSGYSFGFRYGFASPYYPYSYYGSAPWFVSLYNYPHDHGRRPYRGFCSHYGDCRSRDNGRRHGDGSERFAESSDDKSHNREGEDEFTDFDKYSTDESIERNSGGGYSTSTGGSRYVATSGPGNPGDRGVVIRSSKTSKSGKSYLEPGTTTGKQGLDVTSSASTSTSTKPPVSSSNSTRTNSTSRSVNRGSSSSSVSSRQRTHSGRSGYSSSRSLSSGRRSSGSSKTSRSTSPD
jgi:hypothetical protein